MVKTISTLSEKVDLLKQKFLIFQNNTSLNVSGHIISEVIDRQSQSCNLIVFNLP